MESFSDVIKKERENLSERRDELLRQREELDRQIQEVDREFHAIEAYERAKKGEIAAPREGSKRRTGIRQSVLEIVKRHASGIKRAKILEEAGAKGDKRAEQSISNALSNLKKQGHIKLDQKSGYKAA